jgi:hypothetical protein
MVSEVDDAEPTALDRPLFLGREDIGVPHTRDRPCSPLAVEGGSLADERAEPTAPGSSRVDPPLWVLAALAVLGGMAGAVFGIWVAS